MRLKVVDIVWYILNHNQIGWLAIKDIDIKKWLDIKKKEKK
jgi:hypothetical protein